MSGYDPNRPSETARTSIGRQRSNDNERITTTAPDDFMNFIHVRTPIESGGILTTHLQTVAVCLHRLHNISIRSFQETNAHLPTIKAFYFNQKTQLH